MDQTVAVKQAAGSVGQLAVRGGGCGRLVDQVLEEALFQQQNK